MRHKLLKSTSIVSFMTLISRILGFVRDMFITQLFGASGGLDAFFVAFKIPNFMRRLFAEGAFSQAFVPVINEYQAKCSQAEVKQFIDRMAGVLATVTGLVTLVVLLFAPFIVIAFAPGFYWHDPVRFQLTVDMLRITFPYIIFITLTAFSGAILNSLRVFGPPAFAPVFLNVALILAALLSLYFNLAEQSLAYGVLLAGVLQLGFLLMYLQHYNLLPKLVWGWHDNGVRKVLKLMVPALFGVSVAQINLLIDTLFASFLPVGSVTWLYLSDRLIFFPLGVFGVAIATVVLPQLAKQHTTQSSQAFSRTLDWSLRLNCLLGIPATLGLFILAGPILTSLFQYHQFSTFDVEMARLSLMAFAVGLMAFMLVKVLASAYYARQDMRTPVKIGVLAMLVNIILNSLLIKPFAHMGLAAATSIAAFVNMGLLIGFLYRLAIYQPTRGWGKFTLQLLLANLLALAFLLGFTQELVVWFNWGWQQRMLALSGLIVGAIMLYVVTLRLLGVRLRDFQQA